LDSAIALPPFGALPKAHRSESVREMTGGLRHLVTAEAINRVAVRRHVVDTERDEVTAA
jgi:hypothetical protein